MKFEKSKEQDKVHRDAACYRKFLAGSKTLYTKAFWENGPRLREETTKKQSGDTLLPGVDTARN